MHSRNPSSGGAYVTGVMLSKEIKKGKLNYESMASSDNENSQLLKSMDSIREEPEPASFASPGSVPVHIAIVSGQKSEYMNFD